MLQEADELIKLACDIEIEVMETVQAKFKK